MIEGASTGVIERLLERLTAGDWAGYSALLSPDVERIGPYGDRMVGRDLYVDTMAGPLKDGRGTTWDVLVYASDEKTAFARVTANLGPGLGMSYERFDQILALTMDDDSLVVVSRSFGRPRGSPHRVQILLRKGIPEPLVAPRTQQPWHMECAA